MSHKRIFRLLLAPLAIWVALMGASGAFASPLSDVSGTFTTTSATFNSVREVGGNVIPRSSTREVLRAPQPCTAS